MPDTQRARKHVGLLKRKAAIEADLRDVKAALAASEERLLEEFVAEGVSSLKLDGMTLFLKSRTWAKPVAAGDRADDAEYERACRALEEAGWGEYVHERFNVISLSSAVSEAKRNGEIEVVPVNGSPSKFLAFGGTIAIEDKNEIGHRSAS